MNVFVKWGASLAAVALVSGLTLAPAAATGSRRVADDVQDVVFLAEARPVLIRMHIRVDGRPIQAGWDEFMKELFAYLDVNGDGYLSKEEAERVPTVAQMQAGGLSQLVGGRRGGGGNAVTLAALDTDKDGKVSPAELAAYYRTNGLRPFQFQVESGPANPFGKAAALYGQRPEPSVDAVSAAIFALLDEDRDGKLTARELAAAPQALLRMDEDEDEIVTMRELVPNTRPSALNMIAGMVGGSSRSGSAGSKVVLPLAKVGQAPGDLVSAMQARYGKKDKEKKLSRKVLGLDEATFRQLDVNGDGVLDDKELAGFVKRAPDLEVTLRLGSKEEDQARVDVVRAKDKPAALAGRVRREGGVALLDLGATRVELRGRAEEQGQAMGAFNGIIRAQLMAQFKGADKDNKGYLTRKEAEGNRTFGGVYKAMDRDGDGKLTEQEVVAYLDRYAKLQEALSGACVSLLMKDVSRGLFDLLDVNRDGRLSVREMRGAAGLLKQFDRGGKGYFVTGDIPRSYQLTLRRGPVANAADPARTFAAIYGGGYQRKEEGPPAVGPRWFRKMDRNRDGDVSRKEWLFSDEKFRQIDTDGDGLISVAEAQAYDALMRKQK